MALKPDVFLNGNLESWVDANNASDWTEAIIDGGTINRDGVDQRNGTFCARLTKTSAAVVRFEQTQANVYIPGKWYRIEIWTKITAGITGFEVRIWNVDANLYWKPGRIWEAVQHNWVPGLTTSYTRFTEWFHYLPSFNLADRLRFQFRNPSDASGDFFIDDCSFLGPYDHPIVDITGTIRGPGGIALVGTGVITARLNGVGKVSDGTDNKTILPSPQAFTVINGVVAMSLIPITNITLEGGGTPLWSISYDLPGFPKFTESWNLGLVSPIDITQVTKV